VGSRYLPWALPRVLQVKPEIKKVGGCDWHAGHEGDGVYSKGANSVFIPGNRASAIAASAAGKRHGNGRGGRRSNDWDLVAPAGYFHSQIFPVVLSLASVSYSNTATVPASFASVPVALRK
jgi:hypothetical protein